MRRVLCLLLLAASGLAEAGAPCWQVAPEGSTLTFTAVQAGAEFTGVFREFSADICFAPEQLADSHIHVTVNPASVATQNSDRDAALLSADFFFVADYPRVVFDTLSFQMQNATTFTAAGQLSLRGVTRPETLTFGFVPQADGSVLLDGTAVLQRLDYGVGQGEWQDTKWVGNEVRVVFHLKLLPAQ